MGVLSYMACLSVYLAPTPVIISEDGYASTLMNTYRIPFFRFFRNTWFSDRSG
jgi:hypothetical protein